MSEEAARRTERLYGAYYDRVRKYARRFVGCNRAWLPLAEDCVQETFEKAMRQHEKLAGHPNPCGWLLRTCRNLLLDRLRRERGRSAADGAEAPQAAVTRERVLEDFQRWVSRLETLDGLKTLLQRLTKREREVYHAYFAMGRSAEETAREHGISGDAVRAAVKRIRKKARGLREAGLMGIILLAGKIIVLTRHM